MPSCSVKSLEIDTDGPVVRLVQITDSHNFADNETPLRGLNTHHSFSDVLDHAQSFIQRADAILLTGDLAHDEHQQTYKNLHQMMATQHKPVWSLPGNHDNPMEMSHLLSGQDFHYLGHHEAANWEVIVLDSHCPHQAAGLLGDSEIERLQDRLATSHAEYFLIALHHHVLPVQSTWLDSVSLQDAQSFLRVVSNDSRVKGVCCGHIHQCFEKMHNGIYFFSCPSTGTQFAPLKSDFTLDTRPPGFRWIHLYQDGSLRSQVVWLNTAPWN